jgi:hypothetical protein
MRKRKRLPPQPSVRHIVLTHEQKRKEQQYRDYLMHTRAWSDQQAVAYIQHMREEDERRHQGPE